MAKRVLLNFYALFNSTVGFQIIKFHLRLERSEMLIIAERIQKNKNYSRYQGATQRAAQAAPVASLLAYRDCQQNNPENLEAATRSRPQSHGSYKFFLFKDIGNYVHDRQNSQIYSG